jgi:hypothetical protein
MIHRLRSGGMRVLIQMLVASYSGDDNEVVLQ